MVGILSEQNVICSSIADHIIIEGVNENLWKWLSSAQDANSEWVKWICYLVKLIVEQY